MAEAASSSNNNSSHFSPISTKAGPSNSSGKDEHHVLPSPSLQEGAAASSDKRPSMRADDDETGEVFKETWEAVEVEQNASTDFPVDDFDHEHSSVDTSSSPNASVHVEAVSLGLWNLNMSARRFPGILANAFVELLSSSHAKALPLGFWGLNVSARRFPGITANSLVELLSSSHAKDNSTPALGHQEASAAQAAESERAIEGLSFTSSLSTIAATLGFVMIIMCVFLSCLSAVRTSLPSSLTASLQTDNMIGENASALGAAGTVAAAERLGGRQGEAAEGGTEAASASSSGLTTPGASDSGDGDRPLFPRTKKALNWFRQRNQEEGPQVSSLPRIRMGGGDSNRPTFMATMCELLVG